MNKNKTIWDYFNDNIEYPREVAFNPIPYNTVWTYISVTFLNGFINYVNPIKCYLIDRYTPDNENINSVKYQIEDSYEWLTFDGTKGELKDKILKEEIKLYHTELSCFSDDIIILSEIEHNEKDGLNRFMFFWFDMDVSDCSIGRIETNDTKEEIIQSLINWLEQNKEENKDRNIEESFDNGLMNYTELPLSFLKGWLKF